MPRFRIRRAKAHHHFQTFGNTAFVVSFARRERYSITQGDSVVVYLKNLQSSFFQFDWTIPIDSRKVLGFLAQT